jgi:Heavy metal associated domain 2
MHHVPGRLRIKSSVLKGNEQEAQAVQQLLLDQQGILRSEVSTLTGSILIYYDGSAVQAQRIVGLLKRRGYLQPSVPVHPAALSLQQPVTSARDVFVKVLVETLLERSAALLIRAVL